MTKQTRVTVTRLSQNRFQYETSLGIHETLSREDLERIAINTVRRLVDYLPLGKVLIYDAGFDYEDL